MLTVGHFFVDEAAEGIAGLAIHPLAATLLVDPRDHAAVLTVEDKPMALGLDHGIFTHGVAQLVGEQIVLGHDRVAEGRHRLRRDHLAVVRVFQTVVLSKPAGRHGRPGCDPGTGVRPWCRRVRLAGP